LSQFGYNAAIAIVEEGTHFAVSKLPKPTKADLLAANNRTIVDVIGPNLRVLFCGINPGLYSGYTGHHFARPGNRFWPTLFAAGFTERLLKPEEEQELLAHGYGITNLVQRATATAAELSADELARGGARLQATVDRYRPRVLAILGISAYRLAFNAPRATLGQQPEPLGATGLWVLPNPSGLNAHYTPADLARVFGEFRRTIESE
jgi:TDG/mug DNA glycosylase family protein